MANQTSPSSSPRKSDLPPPRKSKGTRQVKPPLASTRLHRFIYVLVGLSALLTAYYSYRILQWKTEVGGWWNLATGTRPDQMQQAGGAGAASGSMSVEDKINELAEALGLPSNDLAKAIAGAVREYVPPASLSSIREQETGKPAVDVLLAGSEQGKKVETEEQEGGETAGVFDSFIGMDEP
ncbi:hypothetical protein K435DRAFT_656592 [Dendrothele bispora CBS 962.96]|uniref:Uncharacterized protein n=1 Tax=Dendrothele bispora (strain CBS 962.96) TaxID=1314807 RepID=A0A4S8MDW6_DENBC|nr:hypothetical protein K435DRAFT_656592 [Dendrothele bispora CBS 962.96]